MPFRGLVFALLLTSSFSYAQGRKPAVEDFVGIEVEHEQVAPQGTESLYNLEQDLNKIHQQKDRPAPKISAPATSGSGWSMTNMVSLAFILGLPVMIWLMIMNHLKRKASVESASNIEVLEKYRKEREKKNEDSDRLAS